VHRSHKLSGMHSSVKPGVQQRRAWLQSARGDKTQPITHRLHGIPPFYHPVLDEHSSLDAVEVRPMPLPWEEQQPEVRKWVTEILKYHVSKPSSKVKKGKVAPAVNTEACENEYLPAVDAGWVSFDPMDASVPSNWNISRLMPDKLYVELINPHTHSTPSDYLAEMAEKDLSLPKIVLRHHSSMHTTSYRHPHQ
jgi:hypothetical protein